MPDKNRVTVKELKGWAASLALQFLNGNRKEVVEDLITYDDPAVIAIVAATLGSTIARTGWGEDDLAIFIKLLDNRRKD